MLTKKQEIFVRENATLAKWRSIRNSLAVFASAPSGFTVWSMIQLNEVDFFKVLVVLIVVSVQALSASRVAKYRTRVRLMTSDL